MRYPSSKWLELWPRVGAIEGCTHGEMMLREAKKSEGGAGVGGGKVQQGEGTANMGEHGRRAWSQVVQRAGIPDPPDRVRGSLQLRPKMAPPRPHPDHPGQRLPAANPPDMHT